MAISKYIQDKFEKITSKSLLNEEEKHELLSLIKSAYSEGQSEGAKNANIVSSKIGNWSNRN